MAISGETVSLVVPIGRSNVVIGGVEGPGPIARGVPLGRLNPMHASSASRTILAHLTDEARGWRRLYSAHVLQAHEGADLDFVV